MAVPQARSFAFFSLLTLFLPSSAQASGAVVTEQQVMLPSAQGTAQKTKILKLQGTTVQHKTETRETARKTTEALMTCSNCKKE